MKNKFRSRRVYGIVSIGIFISGSAALAQEPEWKELPRDEAAAALELISSRISTNRSAIRTWSGKFELDETLRIEGSSIANLARRADPDATADGRSYNKIVRATGEFTIDLQADSLFSVLEAVEPAKLFDTLSGDPLKIGLMRTFQRSIVTPENFLKFSPEKILGEFPEFPKPPMSRPKYEGPVAFREPSSYAKPELKTVVVDPRTFLFDYPVVDSCGRFARMLRSPEVVNLEHVRSTEFRVLLAMVDGSAQFKVQYHSPTHGKEIAVERLFCEVDGCNPRYEKLSCLPSGAVVQSHEWTYERHDHGIVPHSFREHLLTVDGTTTRFDRMYTLVSQRLNEAIDPRTFTVANLGLQDGDRMFDRIARSLTQYKGGALVPLEDNRPSLVARFWRAAVLSSPAVAIFAVVIFAFGRVRARGRRVLPTP